MFKGVVKDSVALYAGVKLAKKARRRSKQEDIETFTPEFKAKVRKYFEDLDEKSKVKYAEAKKARKRSS